ncbi:MAG: hypothetical protein JNJ60_20835 [Rhodocyclaceae bacterium]|nr:hypothetical protein [Rhodocyclaceae bacterium]
MLIECGLEKARSFGFGFESSLACFVHLMFGVAPNFYPHLAVRTALTDLAVQLKQGLSLLPERIPRTQLVWRAQGTEAGLCCFAKAHLRA